MLKPSVAHRSLARPAGSPAAAWSDVPAAIRALRLWWLSARWAEPALMVGLFLVALAIRWPGFEYLPTFTDEVHDTYTVALILQGKIRPLTSFDPYNGPLFNYLEAGLFVLFGPDLNLPRAIVLVTGSLTVPTAYLLGKVWGGRASGLLAAALLTANPVHILVNSRLPWSNCLTPLFHPLAALQLTP